MKNIFICCFIFVSFLTFSQDEKSWEEVLKKNMVNKTITFGKWDDKGNPQLDLTYLGVLKSKKESFKIMNSVFTFSMSGRVNCKILVFNSKNQFQGSYAIDDFLLPSKIENNKLLFKLDDKKRTNCLASFDNGIPNELKLKVNNKDVVLAIFEKDIK